MRVLYILMLLFTFTLLQGQVAIQPTSLSVSISEDSDHVFNIAITNSGTSPVTVYWRIIKGAGWPAEWTTQTCDLFTCYPPNSDECPGSKGQTIAANTTVNYITHFYPNGKQGSSKLQMQLFADKGFKTLLGETDPNANVIADKLLSSKAFTPSGDIKLYPNPAEEYFTVKNDAGVSKVSIFNIVGKEIISYRHYSGNSYDVSDLNKGIYIVRLLDNRGKVIRSIRLSKK